MSLRQSCEYRDAMEVAIEVRDQMVKMAEMIGGRSVRVTGIETSEQGPLGHRYVEVTIVYDQTIERDKAEARIISPGLGDLEPDRG